MTDERDDDPIKDSKNDEQKPLSDPAKRALAEAEARRDHDKPAPDAPREEGGRDGPEPVRYGDWEVKGLATDF